MKAIRSWSGNYCLPRVASFLVMATLIAAIAGCEPFLVTLTITCTEGGSVTFPSKGTHFYVALECCAGTKLITQPEEGYRFVEWTGEGCLPDNPDAAITGVMIPLRSFSVRAHFWPACTPMVAAGSLHTVNLKDNGGVFAVGDSSCEQCNIDIRRGIIQLAAAGNHTVRVTSDTTVAAVGNNDHGQCNVSVLTDIVHVPAGDSHTAGLKSDGTIATAGCNYDRAPVLRRLDAHQLNRHM